MKPALLILTVALLCGRLLAQEKPPATQPAGIELESIDDFLTDNIDPDVLSALQQLDQDKVRRIFSELGQAMKGTNLNQLATLRETAAEVVPLLQKFEETAPYGDWLQTRLDDLEAAEQLGRDLKAAAPRPGAPPLPPDETLKLERKVWAQRLSKRPMPPLARACVPQLKEVFISEGLPPELVWLAEVESSFNADAKSPAGAAGLFQLMPDTARAENLSLWPWDERLQLEPSAHAAARQLRSLHAHYGDWQLVLAAYNAGEGRVDKLLKEQKARTFDAIARRLPAETQMYVPRVEATIWRREGRELEQLKIRKA